MHLAFESGGYPCKSPGEIEKNALDRQLLKRFVDEQSHLIDVEPTKVEDKYVLQYFVPCWLNAFFFDPNRCRNIYPTSLVISECQRAIEASITPNSSSYPPSVFFSSGRSNTISFASRLLDHVKNGPDSDDLLLFLRYLSEIHWLDVYTQGPPQRGLTHGIIYWVCTTLVS